jgi:hypothetical protein
LLLAEIDATVDTAVIARDAAARNSGSPISLV